MLTKDDIKDIGQVVAEKVAQNNQTLRIEFGEVIEDNITPALGEVHSDIKEIKADIKDIKIRLDRVERKVDKAFIDGLDRHEKWIKQIAAKVGVHLEV